VEKKEIEMAAMKKISLVLAVVVLALANVGVASAQFVNFPMQPLGRITCVATFVPNLLRSENLSARTGDSRLDCTNDGVYNPFAPNNITQYVLMNVNLTLNTAVTNMAAGGDALVIVNDNNAWNPQIGSLLPDGGCGFIIGSSGGQFPVPDQRYPCPQKGTITGASTLTWNGIQFPVPGAPNALGTLPTVDANGIPECHDFFDQVSTNSCFDLTTTLRFTNVRGNAAALGAGGTIIATLGVTAFASISVQTNQGAVGIILQGLITSVTPAPAGLQCENFADVFLVHLEEGFAAAFKTLGEPSFVNGDNATENGYPVLVDNRPFANPQADGGTGGAATQATRFIIRLTNVPGGLTITAPGAWDQAGLVGSDPGRCVVDPISAGSANALCVERVSGTDASGAGGSAAGTSGSYAVPLDAAGNGFLVYELKDGNPFLPQGLWISFSVTWVPDTSLDLPAIGSGQVDARFAPLSTVGVAGSDPKPRFVDVGDDPVTVVTVVRCATTLLFPFVTNRFGFDTGIAVSNTSEDWKGTQQQRGVCMVHYIGNIGDDGARVPMDETSTIIEGGEQMTFTLSAGNPVWDLVGAPDFQGFLVIMCEFQWAHGYAFITDGAAGIPTLAQGYLALVLQYDASGARLMDCQFRDGVHVGCPSEGLNH
jgi:hypothetical protein